MHLLVVRHAEKRTSAEDTELSDAGAARAASRKGAPGRRAGLLGMMHFARWKVIVILVVCIGGIIFVVGRFAVPLLEIRQAFDAPRVGEEVVVDDLPAELGLLEQVADEGRTDETRTASNQDADAVSSLAILDLNLSRPSRPGFARERHQAGEGLAPGARAASAGMAAILSAVRSAI